MNNLPDAPHSYFHPTEQMGYEDYGQVWAECGHLSDPDELDSDGNCCNCSKERIGKSE